MFIIIPTKSIIISLFVQCDVAYILEYSRPLLI